MSCLILNIDTATPDASICLSEEGRNLGLLKNDDQKDHAAWLHVAIGDLLQQCGHELKDLDAVGVTSGPGSYTGLRVSMAAAKGFCYTLGKPLLLENTLKVMAWSAIQQSVAPDLFLYCPMIDARRMEVFTAIYNANLEEKLSPSAMVLDEKFSGYFPSGIEMIVFGSGSEKYRPLAAETPVRLATIHTDASHLAFLTALKYAKGEFSPVSTAVPFYGKAFFTPPVK